MGAAIEVVDVSKRFRLYHERYHSLKERLIHFGRTSHEEFWALRDVSFDVPAGSTFGLLGHNGSGKSTLLKCIAGIISPTLGEIRVAGRTAALLELGAGFQPELTGRENIYLNGAILGLSQREIESIFDSIVDFAELEQFIDTQVRFYSSGMYIRLGFAVAVNVDPDILLVDEVLAVGDESFQRKCLDKIKSFQKEGRTILVVTHAADLVQQICDEAATFDQGVMIELGTPGQAVLALRDSLQRRGLAHEGRDPGADRTLDVRIEDVRVVYPEAGRHHLLPDEPLTIEMDYVAPSGKVDDVVFAINVSDQAGNRLLGTNSLILGEEPYAVEGAGTARFRLGRVPLMGGVFKVATGIHSSTGARSFDHRAERDFFEVMNPGRTVGLVNFRPEVEVERR